MTPKPVESVPRVVLEYRIDDVPPMMFKPAATPLIITHRWRLGDRDARHEVEPSLAARGARWAGPWAYDLVG
jgi:hypothetical protein